MRVVNAPDVSASLVGGLPCHSTHGTAGVRNGRESRVSSQRPAGLHSSQNSMQHHPTDRGGCQCPLLLLWQELTCVGTYSWSCRLIPTARRPILRRLLSATQTGLLESAEMDTALSSRAEYTRTHGHKSHCAGKQAKEVRVDLEPHTSAMGYRSKPPESEATASRAVRHVREDRRGRFHTWRLAPPTPDNCLADVVHSSH